MFIIRTVGVEGGDRSCRAQSCDRSLVILNQRVKNASRHPTDQIQYRLQHSTICDTVHTAMHGDVRLSACSNAWRFSTQCNLSKILHGSWLAGDKLTSQLQQGSLEEPQAAFPLDLIFERSSEFSFHPPHRQKVQYRIHIDYSTGCSDCKHCG